jgi:hypothetical protein
MHGAQLKQSTSKINNTISEAMEKVAEVLRSQKTPKYAEVRNISRG